MFDIFGHVGESKFWNIYKRVCTKSSFCMPDISLFLNACKNSWMTVNHQKTFAKVKKQHSRSKKVRQPYFLYNWISSISYTVSPHQGSAPGNFKTGFSEPTRAFSWDYCRRPSRRKFLRDPRVCSFPTAGFIGWSISGTIAQNHK